MGKKLKILFLILFIGFVTLSLNKVFENISFAQEDFTVYKPGVEVIKALNGTGYAHYVQMIYVDPRNENRLMVLIRPNYWVKLNEKDKKIMLSRIEGKWKKIYKRSRPKSELTPKVHFANI